jgi:hypothetical protein
MEMEQRLIVCCNYRAHSDEEKGQSIALYEKDKETSKLIKINKDKYFSDINDCEVHIVPNPSNENNYSLLNKKYSNRLYLIQCVENRNIENGSDLSKNKSNLFKIEPVEPNAICEVIYSDLPDETNPKIEVDSPPLSRHIFIQDSSFTYGPFEYEISQHEETKKYTLNIKKPGDIKYLGIILPKLATLKYKNSDLEPYQDNFNYPTKFIDGIEFNHTFISNVSDLKLVDKELMDYGFMDELAKAIGTLVKETNTKGISQNQLTLLSTRIKNKKNNFNFNTDYVLKQLSDTIKFDKVITGGKEDLKSLVVEQVLNENEELRNYCLDLLKNNDALIQDVRNTIIENQTDVTRELNDLRNELVIKNSDLNIIRKQIEQAKLEEKEINEDKEKQVIEQLKKQQTSLNDEIITLSEKKESLLSKYEEMFEYDDFNSKLENIKRSIEVQNEIYDDKVRKIGEKEQDIKIQNEELLALSNKSSEQYKKELLSVKNSIDVLTQIDTTEECIKFDCVKGENLLYLNDTKNLIDYIKYIQVTLSDNERDISIEQIINLLVCIDLSFITILSGLPGTGKTSLISILGEKVLNSRFNNVQVGRGWSSERDLLGYFNPITNSYISSGTGMYEYLDDIEHDERINIVLLDEANLSPIEHYWSKFMGLSDSFEGSEFNFTNNKSVNLKNNLRFVATINNDMTTEPISPRLLDRAPCIRLDVFSQFDGGNKSGLDTILENDLLDLKNKFDNKAIDFSDYQKQLSNCVCDKDFLEPLNDIIDSLKTILIIDGHENESFGSRIHLSERRYQVIKNYLDISISVYSSFIQSESNSESNWITSIKNSYFLDFAISEFILPLINGHGRNFKNRVNAIKKELLNIEQQYNFELPITLELISRLIRQGEEDLDTYDFMSLR